MERWECSERSGCSGKGIITPCSVEIKIKKIRYKFDCQYFKLSKIKIKQSTEWTTIILISAKFLNFSKQALQPFLLPSGNVQHYPNPPQISDIEVVALSITAEILSTLSENHLMAGFTRRCLGSTISSRLEEKQIHCCSVGCGFFFLLIASF